MDEEMLKFLRREVSMLSWNGSIQNRRRVYRDRRIDETPTQYQSSKDEVRNQIIEFAFTNLVPHYEDKQVDVESHYQYLQCLFFFARETGSGIFAHTGYTYGMAAKFFHLLLKYLWCLRQITEPRLCPLDRKILNDAGYNGIGWTLMDEGVYRGAMGDIQERAETLHLTPARYELEAYNRLRP